MTTPIDTTRLRKRAEAVRDAGVKSTYAHHVVKRLVDAGHSDLTSARKDARDAAESLRAAQKRLYRDAPPDGIILALLDEVERLRARPTWERVLRIANGCTDYGGGHHGADHEVYQHGIWTVCNVLKNACEQGDKPDMQLRVVEAIGAEAMRAAEPEEGGDHG